jgi:hypothetical protein
MEHILPDGVVGGRAKPSRGAGSAWNLNPQGPWRNRVRRGFGIEDDLVKMMVKSFVTMINFN